MSPIGREFGDPERGGDIPGIDVPHCYTCEDHGCRDCQPTRFDVWRWTIRGHLCDFRDWVLRRNNDELPF